MEINGYKKILMGTVLLGLNSFLVADGLIAQDNMRQEKNKSEGTPSSYLGDKRPPYNNPNRFMVEASFIYWQADADGLEYGLSQDFTRSLDVPTATGVDSATFQDRRLDFKWDPGFKVGAGVIFGQEDEWDLFLNWTWLHSKASNSFSSDIPPELIISNFLLSPAVSTRGFSTATLGAPFLYGPVTSGNSHWKLKYNTLDFELGRNFFLGKNFSVRPIIGVRAAWIHQSIKTNYTALPITTIQDDEVTGSLGTVGYAGNYFTPIVGGDFSSTRQFTGKNNYTGVGLRGGFDMNWNFTDHFCAYSTVSGSVLYGLFNVEEKFTGVTIESGNEIGFGDYNLSSLGTLNDKYHRTRTNIQVLLGLMWHTGFNNDKQHLSIGVSYEVNEWFQQNELRSFELGAPGVIRAGESKVIDVPYYSISDYRVGGDLGLHGVNFDVKFDF